MHETCKSCGTVFEVNGSVLTNNIQWFKCGVCDEKWALSSTQKESLIEFFETLEDDDDVQNIFSNVELKIN